MESVQAGRINGDGMGWAGGLWEDDSRLPDGHLLECLGAKQRQQWQQQHQRSENAFEE